MKIDRVEIARDLMGLGSIPFLILVVVRVGMAGNFLELFHIMVAVALLVVVSHFLRNVDYHGAFIVILVIFTSVFYDDIYYTVFAALTAIATVYGFVRYLKRTDVWWSVGLGFACSGASYLLSLPLDIPNI